MAKQHRIAITMTQETNGEADNNSFTEEFSDSTEIHLIKIKVFTEAFTKAVNEATQTLCDMGLSQQPSNPGKPNK